MRIRPLLAATSLAAVLPALAVVAPTAAAAPAPAVVPVAKATKLTVTKLPTVADVGQRITVAGTAKAGKATKVKVVVQRRYGAGAWQSVGSDTTDKKGRYSAQVPLVQGGPTSFRVKVGKKASAAQSLAVYEWLNLAEQPHVFGASIAQSGVTSVVGGTSLPQSIESASGDVNLVWAVAGCTGFRAWTGFLDSERTGLDPAATQTLGVRAIVDPATSPAPVEYETPVGPAVARAATLPAGTRYLHLAVGSSDASAVLGSPQARCNAAELAPLRYQDVFGGGE